MIAKEQTEGATYERLADMLNQRYGVKVDLITDIGPIIGSHCGPGTLAVFFIGKNR